MCAYAENNFLKQQQQPPESNKPRSQYGSTSREPDSGYSTTSGSSTTTNTADMSLSFNKSSSKTISAPTSPAKTRESLLQRVQSLTGVARDQGASFIGECVDGVWRKGLGEG